MGLLGFCWLGLVVGLGYPANGEWEGALVRWVFRQLGLFQWICFDGLVDSKGFWV